MGWLFVYGTLMPGHLRWRHVAGDVAERRPGTIAGTLYDTGLGYPALVLAGGAGTAGTAAAAAGPPAAGSAGPATGPSAAGPPAAGSAGAAGPPAAGSAAVGSAAGTAGPPAAGRAAGTVHGWLLALPPGKASAVLERLDRIEGPSYRRSPVTTADGTAAVTYEYLGSTAGFTAIPGGAWTRTDER